MFWNLKRGEKTFLKTWLSNNKVTLCLPQMLCTQEYKTETSCYSSQLAECTHRVERLGHIQVAKKGEKSLSPYIHSQSGFKICFYEGCCCILFEKRSGRGERSWKEKPEQGRYSIHIYGVPGMHSYDDEQDCRLCLFQSFQYNWENDKKICNYNAMR